MTYIRFFSPLYWFAPFLKFGPLPSENSRCAPGFSNKLFSDKLDIPVMVLCVVNRGKNNALEQNDCSSLNNGDLLWCIRKKTYELDFHHLF